MPQASNATSSDAAARVLVPIAMSSSPFALGTSKQRASAETPETKPECGRVDHKLGVAETAVFQAVPRFWAVSVMARVVN